MLVAADHNFEEIKNDLPQYRTFLNKSRLFIFYGTVQIPFKKNFAVSDLKAMLGLLKDSDFGDNFLCLINIIERLEDEQRGMAKQKGTEKLKEVSDKLAKAKHELDTFPIQELDFHDSGITIQIIYPSVDIEAIQTIKTHRLVNQHLPCHCRACIRTILVGQLLSGKGGLRP